MDPQNEIAHTPMISIPVPSNSPAATATNPGPSVSQAVFDTEKSDIDRRFYITWVMIGFVFLAALVADTVVLEARRG